MSASVRNGELAGTTITSYSPVRRAIGVTSCNVTGDRCVTMPPSMISPDTSIASPRPLFRADESRQTDRAGRAGNVLDRRSSNDAGSLEHLLHHACGLIPATAGCSGSDQTKLVELWLLGSGDAAR